MIQDFDKIYNEDFSENIKMLFSKTSAFKARRQDALIKINIQSLIL